jgi:hypothetical protein
MSTDDRLLARIRGEYDEMPGLRLTLSQACRLWQLDGTTCLALLERLVVERFLHRTHDGTYIALGRARPKPAKAALPDTHPTGVHAKRRA